MSELPLHVQSLPGTNKPMRIAARQAHWLQAAFKNYLEIVGEDIGCTFEVDSVKLAACFVKWLRAVSSQNPKERALRKKYFGFSAGLMLRELLSDMPTRAVGRPKNAAADTPSAFWPEGVACTMFCLAVLHAVEVEEFAVRKSQSADINDLRFWWSLKENSNDDSNLVVPYFENIIGIEPNWMLPGVFTK
jgi:hypothetical protein